MTGVMNAAFVVAGASNVAVTVGSSSGNHGYHFTDRGASSPATFLGITIAEIQSIDSNRDLRFILGGTRSQSIFSYLLINDGTGAFRKYNSADAVFSTGGGVTSWLWGDGSNKVWNSTDSGEVHVVQIFR